MNIPAIRFSALSQQSAEQLRQVQQGQPADIEAILKEILSRTRFDAHGPLEEVLIQQIDSLQKPDEVQRVIALLADPEKTSMKNYWGTDTQEYIPSEKVVHALARAIRRAGRPFGNL